MYKVRKMYSGKNIQRGKCEQKNCGENLSRPFPKVKMIIPSFSFLATEDAYKRANPNITTAIVNQWIAAHKDFQFTDFDAFSKDIEEASVHCLQLVEDDYLNLEVCVPVSPSLSSIYASTFLPFLHISSKLVTITLGTMSKFGFIPYGTDTIETIINLDFDFILRIISNLFCNNF
ncbi:hypothetical protein BpHYR1_035493 [Brachionus plicatilis]|uniref:Uncharacterized protein n=1 Tax=Brachionus plicatilis TaxID=10195 RepID=A0A3M7QEK8_BRAPC|nr:hypothetical protein BpHYR1_035493 [Brachionus plicatilis]